MRPRPRILVTGSSGRVGSAIAAGFSADHEIRGLDRVPGRYTTHRGSVEDAALVREAMNGVRLVVHTASLHAPHVGHETEARFRAVNVVGTEVLLDAALAAGVARFVYTSSTSVYGHAMEPADAAVWVTEALPPAPRDIYDETKLVAENLCRAVAEEGLMESVSLRISRCFAEAERLVALHRLHRGVDLRDVAQAHRLAARMPLAGYQVYNVSAQTPFTVDDCAELLADAPVVLRRRVPGIEAFFAARDWRLPDTIDRVYAIDKAGRDLGYSPRFNFPPDFSD